MAAGGELDNPVMTGVSKPCHGCPHNMSLCPDSSAGAVSKDADFVNHPSHLSLPDGGVGARR